MSLLSLPIPKGLRGLITAMETLHTPKGPYTTSRGPTEETFITFMPGPLQDGSPIPAVFYNSEAAIRAFWFEFLKYSEDHKGDKLYWRMKPMVYGDGLKGTHVFEIRARFYLSNKPVQSRDIEAECLGLRRSA